MYGSRTAPNSWQDHLWQTLESMGLKRLVSDPNVHVGKGVYVLAYVDASWSVAEVTLSTASSGACRPTYRSNIAEILRNGGTVKFLVKMYVGLATSSTCSFQATSRS